MRNFFFFFFATAGSNHDSSHGRGRLGGYLLAWTVPLSFCAGLLGLAVSAQFAVAVPRWFILAYGAGCAVVTLRALLLCRPWQRLRKGSIPGLPKHWQNYFGYLLLFLALPLLPLLLWFFSGISCCFWLRRGFKTPV
jgi:hypothetical protein